MPPVGAPGDRGGAAGDAIRHAVGARLVSAGFRLLRGAA
jgi:hypothetical protein